MKRINMQWIIGLLLVMIALSGHACSKEKSGEKKAPGHEKMVEAYQKSMLESKKNVVAKVNGATIPMYDLISEMNAVAPQYIKPGQKRDPKVDEKVRKEALDRLIYRELAVQEAVRQGMKVPTQAIADNLKKLKADLKTEDAYREKLKQFGLTEEELKKQLERSVLVEMITEKEIFDKVKVDPKQVEKTYAKEKASLKGPSGKPLSFEEARPLIEEKLMKPAVNKREDEWVDGLKKAAKIEITLGQSAKEIHSVK